MNSSEDQFCLVFNFQSVMNKQMYFIKYNKNEFQEKWILKDI